MHVKDDIIGPPIPRAVAWPAVACVILLGLFFVGTVLQAHASGAEPLLPDLVADPPDAVSLATDSSTGTSRLLLRFNGYVHNKGPGAIDFRGSREKPNVSKATEEEVERARLKAESLPQKTEEELAIPPMKVFQRLFTTNAGNPEESEKYLERPHVEESSGGEMIYVSADGHHHWHLQRVAKYSLWNSTKTAEVAPAQKVGFCLEDSQHVEPQVGPAKAVYADNVAPYRDFCQQYRPNATGLYEGISPGWRDVYTHELAFQWVEASNVLPGEYWLREDVNPLGVIKETGGANTPAYATSPTIIPGFDALAQVTGTHVGEAATVTLTSKAWSDAATPKYTIASQPQHGKLGAVSNNKVTYTPNAGYSGPDSFTFSAADPNSQFPTSPAVATVSIEVTAATGKVLLAGDPSTAYSVGDQTTAGREEAFQFTAKSTGTVEELQFRTNGVANTGVTGLAMGIFADSAGKPGEVLGTATATGEPGTSSWVKATGLWTPLVNGTKYWLVVLPLGASSKRLHFNAAVLTGGAGNVESTAGGLGSLSAQSSWEAYNQGPVGFQAIGFSTAQPAVTIEGAPTSMVAGTSVQLSAHVSNDIPTVTWKASAGSITTGGLYTAPAEPPVGGTAVVSATTSKGAHDQRTIEITAATHKALLAGDSSAAYTVGDQTTAGREEAFQFTAGSTGTVEELLFRTNGVADTGITGIVMGVFADNAGKPGEVLGTASASGEPGTSSWIKATGLSTPVVSGTKYWLVVLPLGEGARKLYFNAAVLAGGTGNVESSAGGLTALSAQSSWEAYNQGPVGFQAVGRVSGVGAPLQAAASIGAARVARVAPTRVVPPSVRPSRPQPSVAIAGAPSSMIAGTSVQLSATVADDGHVGAWSASAGSIASGGLYTAPSVPPAGGTVTVTAASTQGAHDQRTIEIVPVPRAEPAPAAPLPTGAASSPIPGDGGNVSPSSPAVSRPEAMLIGHTLVMTTEATAAGRVALSAYLGKRRLGGCGTQSPANRSFTCRLTLGGRVSPHTPVSALASLRIGGRVLRSLRRAAPVQKMKMGGASDASTIIGHWHLSASWQLMCSPSAPTTFG
jgi:hypothetical protein